MFSKLFVSLLLLLSSVICQTSFAGHHHSSSSSSSSDSHSHFYRMMAESEGADLEEVHKNELLLRNEVSRILGLFWYNVNEAMMTGDDSGLNSIAASILTDDFRLKSSLVDSESGWFESRDELLDSESGYVAKLLEFCGGVCDIATSVLSSDFVISHSMEGVFRVKLNFVNYFGGNDNSFSSTEHEMRESTFRMVNGKWMLSQDENIVSSLD